MVFLLVKFFWPGNNIIRWMQTKSEIKDQQRQMELYQEQIDQMNENIEELKNNKDTLEKFARERYNFAAPGEDVYIIED